MNPPNPPNPPNAPPLLPAVPVPPVAPQRVRYSDAERTFIVISFSKNGRNAPAAQDAFHRQFPHRPVPSRKTVHNLFHKLETCHTLKNLHKGSKPRVLTNDKLQELNGLFLMETTYPSDVRRSSGRRNDIGLSKSSFNRGARQLHMWPYKPKRWQKILPTDLPRRLQYCEVLTALGDEVLDHCVFSDESYLDLDGTINKQLHRDRLVGSFSCCHQALTVVP